MVASNAVFKLKFGGESKGKFTTSWRDAHRPHHGRQRPSKVPLLDALKPSRHAGNAAR